MAKRTIRLKDLLEFKDREYKFTGKVGGNVTIRVNGDYGFEVEAIDSHGRLRYVHTFKTFGAAMQRFEIERHVLRKTQGV